MSPSSRCLAAAFLAALIFAPGKGFSAIDQNGNGLSDVWELIYGAATLSPSLDTDGDGFTNLQEATAGTDPRNSKSRFALSLDGNPAAGHLRFETQGGKIYSLQAQSSLTANNWTEIAKYEGTGLGIEAEFAAGTATRQFFRATITDQDSTGGGVTDWEKLAVGYDPATLHTDRYAITDSARIAGQLSSSDTISVAVTDGQMRADWPTPGVVAIRRSGGLKALTVNFTVSGTAVRNADYTLPEAGSVTIPVGVREVWLQFTPANPALSASRTIVTTLSAGAGYAIGSSPTATLILSPASALPGPKAAARFLFQASFGPDSAANANDLPPNVTALMAQGFPAWLDEQFARPLGKLQPYVDWRIANNLSTYGDQKPVAFWNRVLGSRIYPGAPTQLPDPLRQRMAFALSQIFVVSDKQDGLNNEPQGMLNFYDLFITHAFGNYRALLRDVAMHPIMGIYLSHMKNRKGDPALNTFPDENFAREVMQLFSIGLWELNPDGTRRLDASGQPIPTYDNVAVSNFARVFTGFSWGGPGADSFEWPAINNLVPMRPWDEQHDLAPKTLLKGATLPARTASRPDTGAAVMADVEAAIDNLFYHPNTGPFICRQLIQRFVTSNPSPAYVGRIAAVFANNGSNVRGDLKAVLRAILLDNEARSPAFLALPASGKAREPYLQTANLAVAFRAVASGGDYFLAYLDDRLGQQVLSSPSVFNFYRPGFAPAGPIYDAGLVAPEFQIINSITILARANYFESAIRDCFNRWGPSDAAERIAPDLTPELALADNPDALLRRLNLVLTAGNLSPRELQIIRESLQRIDASVDSNWKMARVQAAIWLIANSAETAILR